MQNLFKKLLHNISYNFKIITILLFITAKPYRFSDRITKKNREINIPPISKTLAKKNSLRGSYEEKQKQQKFFYTLCLLRLKIIKLLVGIHALDDCPQTVAQFSQPKYFDLIEKNFVIKARWTKNLRFYLCKRDYSIVGNNIVYGIKNEFEIFDLEFEIILFLFAAYNSKICELTSDIEKNVHICSHLNFEYSPLKVNYILPYNEDTLLLFNLQDNVTLNFENEKYQFKSIKLNNALLNEINTILKENYVFDLHNPENILNYIGKETDPEIVVERLKAYFAFSKFDDPTKFLK